MANIEGGILNSCSVVAVEVMVKVVLMNVVLDVDAFLIGHINLIRWLGLYSEGTERLCCHKVIKLSVVLVVDKRISLCHVHFYMHITHGLLVHTRRKVHEWSLITEQLLSCVEFLQHAKRIHKLVFANEVLRFHDRVAVDT